MGANPPRYLMRTVLGNNELRLGTPIKKLLKNVRRNCRAHDQWIAPPTAKTDRHLAIVAGGPSLKDDIDTLAFMAISGATIWAVNGTHDYLIERGIIPDAQVIMDASTIMLDNVKNPRKDVEYLIASRCSPQVFKALEGYNVTLWNSFDEDVEKVLEEFGDRPYCIVGGGGTIGLRCFYLGYAQGFRNFHVFGMDSSYEDEEGDHAYAQDQDTPRVTIEVVAGGKTYKTAPWMAAQVEDFKAQARVLLPQGCTIRVYGRGLLPDVVNLMNTAPRHIANVDEMCQSHPVH